MEKYYVILGNNNYWYSTFKASTQKEIDSAVKEVKMNIGKGSDTNLAEPTELIVYEVNFKENRFI